MQRLELAVEIAAPLHVVWRALCEPSIVVQWDSEVVEPINPPPDYPRPGQTVRWRCRDGSVLIDRPQQVESGRRLRSLLESGSWDIDETYDLSTAAGRTMVDVSLDLTVRTPLIGWLVERLSPGAKLQESFEASLEGLKQWCEAHAAPDNLAT